MHDEQRYGLRSFLRTIGSLWLAAVLLVLWLVAMACATVFESTHGTEQTLEAFYHSTWFTVLICLLLVNVLAALLLRLPYSRKQTGFVLAHISLIVIFGGAMVTKYLSVNGQLGLVEGDTSDQFNVDREILTITDSGTHASAHVDLTSDIEGCFNPIDFNDTPGVTLGDVRLDVLRYVPDGDWAQQVLDDAPTLQPAVEVTLSRGGTGRPAWIFAGHNGRVGGLPVGYRRIEDRDELARLISDTPTTQPASVGTVRIEYQGATYEFPVEEGLEAAVPVGQTGYTARVLRYLPHATVGDNGGIVNASEEPRNPYIEVELTNAEGSETRRAFARFPDFESMHGPSKAAALRVVFVSGTDSEPATPVEVLGGPDGELYVRFASAGTPVTSHKLEVGSPVPSPWPGHSLTLLRHFEHARVERSFEPIEPVREDRSPALLVRLQAGEQTTEQWIEKHFSVPLALGDVGYELVYTGQEVPLGFSVELERFTVGFYPGGERPRSFESQITITDPQSGRSQSRVVSMNHPTSFGGYTLYQHMYRQDGNRMISYLNVSWDPGKPIVFAGYIGLMVGMLITLVTRMAEYRKQPGARDAGERAVRAEA